MYRLRRSEAPTKEEKVAVKMSTLACDFSLDLEAVGLYLSNAIPHIAYTRLIEILESARYNKEVAEYYRHGGYYDEGKF